MCAEVGVDIGGQISANTWSVLGPVGEVAHQFGGRDFRKGEKKLQ